METTTILTSSLLAAIVSAGVAAVFQIVIKNKEYRNEYYKKVIDKRINAVESAEILIGIFSLVTIVAETQQYVCSFFVKNPYANEGDALEVAIQGLASHNAWLSPNSSIRAHNFIEKLTHLRADAKKYVLGEPLANYYLDNHDSVVKLKLLFEQSIAEDMSKLYDVEAFFKSKRDSLING